ncbi:MAG: CDP-alcohol phosphatidyltransferase family protein [Proteobacteria bacterium]|nr:CDP-alcohol phosphatidyltransferase family protein [Pseudomonadota bacterium]MDA1206675.1 CDP-alcohol phosphatidyltransferase family protein [Pseudomonadota bacterium]
MVPSRFFEAIIISVLKHLPNALSLSRLGLALWVCWAIFDGSWHLALMGYVLAVITDLIDGPMARYLHTASARGGLVDHGADAVFVISTIGAFSLSQGLPLLLSALIAVAFIHYSFGSGAHQGRPLIASRLGRYNGIAYFALVGIFLGTMTLPSLSRGAPFLDFLYWALVISTALSILDRWLSLRQRR